METKILVAYHKPYWTPENPIYHPIQVGAIGKPPIRETFLRDDVGDNISKKNPYFCELTGMYWAWKNLHCDIIGFCHYRRYFVDHRFWCRPKERLLKQTQAEALIEGVDIVVPRKRYYVIETRENQYIHAHHKEDLLCLHQVMSERSPEYLVAYERMLRTRSGHIFNMFYMRKESFDTYMTWLFDLLFEVESRLDISNYSPYDSRVFGFLAERLLDVWIEHNRLIIQECPVKNLERQNWIRKIGMFVRRKYRPQ